MYGLKVGGALPLYLVREFVAAVARKMNGLATPFSLLSANNEWQAAPMEQIVISSVGTARKCLRRTHARHATTEPHLT